MEKNMELLKALDKFNSICPKIKMECVNPYHKSKYANLETILDTIKPHLKATSLIVTQKIESENIVTALTHLASGEQELQTCPIIFKEEGNAQQFGAGITYGRRYSISVILNLCTEEDDDGNTASGHKNEEKKEAKQEEVKPDEHGFTIKVSGIKDNQYYRTYALEKNANGIDAISLKLAVCNNEIKIGDTVTFLGCIKNAKGYWNADKVFKEA